MANVNDAPVLDNNAGLSLNEGATATVTTAMLQVSDADNSGLQLTYTLTSVPAHGTLALSGSTLAAGASFTQNDVDMGRLTYAHDDSETVSEGFSFTVSDGAGAGIATMGFGISVTPVNDAPALNLDTITISRGGSVVLGTGQLSASDADSAAGTLVFAVSGVTHGQFELQGAPGVAVTSFTQTDVSAGLVRFVHDGTNSAPVFEVEVSDGVLSAGPLAASISFSGGNGGVPITAPGRTPTFLPEPARALPTATSNPLPASEPAPDANGTVEPVSESAADTAEQGSAPQAATEDTGLAPGQPAAAFNGLAGHGIDLQPAQSRGLIKLTTLHATPNEFAPGGIIEPTVELLNILPAQLQFIRSEPLDWSVQSAFPDEATEEDQRDQITVLLDP